MSADPESMANDEKVREAVWKDIDAVNQRFARIEQIKRFAILPRDLSQEEGELTPTLKVKRSVVYTKYEPDINGLYDGESETTEPDRRLHHDFGGMARPYGDAMPTETPTPSGDGLLALIAFAVIVVVAAEAAFIAYSSWWLLVFVLLRRDRRHGRRHHRAVEADR